MLDLINTADAAKYLQISERKLLRSYQNKNHKFPTPIRGAEINYYIPNAYFWKYSEIVAWGEWKKQNSTGHVNTSYKDFLKES